MPTGRPSKYDPAFCDAVIKCGQEGMSKAEMAAELGVAYSTFDLWAQQHPEFSEAVKEARRLSQAWWEKQGRIATFGAIDGFNATSYIFQMKNRFREDWNDTVKQEVNANVKHEGEGLSLLLANLDAISSRAAGSASE
jgi:hypothetical protein